MVPYNWLIDRTGLIGRPLIAGDMRRRVTVRHRAAVIEDDPLEGIRDELPDLHPGFVVERQRAGFEEPPAIGDRREIAPADLP